MVKYEFDVHGSIHLGNVYVQLTLILLTTTLVAPPSNASKWQIGFNSAFKGLKVQLDALFVFFVPLCFLAQHVSSAVAPILRTSNCSLQP
jgi:hypothetical protein